jgi:hypothetical protein
MKTPEKIKSTGNCLDKKPAIFSLAAIYWALLIPMGLMLAIFLSSLLRTDGSTPGFAFIGRIPSELQSGLHVPMFFGLTLIVLVFLKRFEKCERNQILFAFVLANYVGILNEGLQMLIPGRNASLGDVGLNLAGTLLGLVFYFGIRKWKSVNRGNSDSGGLRSAFGRWREHFA